MSDWDSKSDRLLKKGQDIRLGCGSSSGQESIMLGKEKIIFLTRRIVTVVRAETTSKRVLNVLRQVRLLFINYRIIKKTKMECKGCRAKSESGKCCTLSFRCYFGGGGVMLRGENCRLTPPGNGLTLHFVNCVYL